MDTLFLPCGLHRKREDVADAAFGADDRGVTSTVLELAAQAHDMHVDAAVEYVFVDARCLQQVFA